MLKFIKHNMETITGIEIFPMISLVIFFLFFVGLIIYVARMSKGDIDTIGAIPLDDNSLSPTSTTTQNPLP